MDSWPFRPNATLTRSQVSSIVQMLNDDDEMRELRENLYFTERKIYEHMFDAVSTLMCANCAHLIATMPELKQCRRFHSICVCAQSVLRREKYTFFALFISMSSDFISFLFFRFKFPRKMFVSLPSPHSHPQATISHSDSKWAAVKCKLWRLFIDDTKTISVEVKCGRGHGENDVCNDECESGVSIRSTLESRALSDSSFHSLYIFFLFHSQVATIHSS